MVALNADEASFCQAVVGIFRELARRDLGLPVGTAKVVFDHLLAVQPMLDVIAVDDDARLVPLAEGLDDAGGGALPGAGRPPAGGSDPPPPPGAAHGTT